MHANLVHAVKDGEPVLIPALCSVLNSWRDDILKQIPYELEAMANLRAGDMDYCPSGASGSRAEGLAQIAERLKGLVDELAACDSLLVEAESAAPEPVGR